MLAASSRLRFSAALLASALATLIPSIGRAQIDLSLNVFYANPANIGSGGTWELVAKSTNPGTFGISALTAKISNINPGSIIEGPRGLVNGANIAGFRLLGDSPHPASPPTPAYRELVLAQVPLLPLPSGSEETLLYGVGTLANGAPNYPGKPAGSNSIGPLFTSFTSPQDIAWATGDIFGEAAWSTAARMLSGTFAAGLTPGFVAGSSGNIFTSLPPTNATFGNTATASAITAIVRTNLAPGGGQSADYNRNGIVDAADYVLWRKTQGSVAAPPGSGADGNADGMINTLDYDLWRSRYGNPMGAGSGAGLSTAAVPEPASCLLLAIGALLVCNHRRSRSVSNQMNNSLAV